MQLDFSNRHIVVTGGTGALGTAIVGLLLNRGAVCHVPALGARDVERFTLRSHERVRCAEGVDLADEGAVRRFYARFDGKGGREGGERLWASLHIAGGFDMGPITETSLAAWEGMFRMNAATCFLCCRESVRVMRAGGGGGVGVGGRIVNVAARPALRPEQGARMTAYTASKAAVAAFTTALAAEVKDDGILVNAVAPSIMDTPANRSAMPDADHASWPKVDEVASAIAWLASADNTLTSGVVMPVYGRA